jgi:magnesium-transporting ATPase (P-type)
MKKEFEKMNTKKGTGTRGKKLIYEEKAPFSNIMRLLMVLIFLILVLSILIAFFADYSGLEKEPVEGQFILILVILILTLTVWGFFKMKFRITEESVEAVMPPFSYRVLFSEIKEVSTTGIPWYVGWGLRIWGRRLAFVSMHKKAVKIQKENGFFKALVLTTGDPDDFIRMVKQGMNSISDDP